MVTQDTAVVPKVNKLKMKKLKKKKSKKKKMKGGIEVSMKQILKFKYFDVSYIEFLLMYISQ